LRRIVIGSRVQIAGPSMRCSNAYAPSTGFAARRDDDVAEVQAADLDVYYFFQNYPAKSEIDAQPLSYPGDEFASRHNAKRWAS
jgi:hypothetical protein